MKKIVSKNNRVYFITDKLIMDVTSAFGKNAANNIYSHEMSIPGSGIDMIKKCFPKNLYFKKGEKQ